MATPMVGVSFLLLFGMVIAVLALAWLVARALRRGRQPQVTLPSCAQCGYAVRGIASLTCPECGADLREVGIVTPQALGVRSGLGLVGFVLLWTVLLPIPALIVTSLGFRAIPQSVTTHLLVTLVPQSGDFQSVGVETTVTHATHITSTGVSSSSFSTGSSHQSTMSFGLPPNLRPQTVTVTLLSNIQPGVLTPPLRASIDPNSLSYEFTTPQGTARGPSFDPAAAEKYLVAGGVPANAASLKDEAYELAAVVTGFCQGQSTITVHHFSAALGNNVTRMVHSSSWTGWAALLFWLAVYAGGIALFVRAHRKRITASPIPSA